MKKYIRSSRLQVFGKKFRKIYRETPVSESYFGKIAACKCFYRLPLAMESVFSKAARRRLPAAILSYFADFHTHIWTMATFSYVDQNHNLFLYLLKT